MSSIDVAFSRTLLSQAHGLVRQHFPEQPLTKGTWVYRFHNDHWEFHGPEGFYWHGTATNAYEARYEGWMAWLKSKGCLDDKGAGK